MSRRWQTCILCSASIALLAVASVIVFSRASTKSAPPPNNQESRKPKKLRNLVLQPEAAAVNRKPGNRFRSDNGRSVLVGTITIGSDRQPVTIIRTLTDTGEAVELNLTGGTFIWTEAEGIKKAEGATASEAERLAIERLVFDSPDQFVLAQLRGASYQTIVRNLRPTDARDDYSGPLWTMVRVNDPQTNESAAPKSPWRLYFVNSISRVRCVALPHLLIAGRASQKTTRAEQLKWLLLVAPRNRHGPAPLVFTQERSPPPMKPISPPSQIRPERYGAAWPTPPDV